MFRTALLAAALLWPAHVLAQSVPPEVMEHYRVYAAELNSSNPDTRLIQEAAYDAWQEAEDRLGSSRLTGDLAINFAETRVGHVRDETVDPTDAYARAAELADHYPASERNEVFAQRQILHAAHLLNDSRTRQAARRARSVLDTVSERLRGTALETSTYMADVEVLRTQSYVLDRDDKKALRQVDLAKDAFAETDDGLYSVYRFQLPLFEAVAAREAGQDLRAARALHTLVEDHFRATGRYTGPSATAYGEWLKLRDDLKKRTDESEVAELLAWTLPPSPGADDPAIRIPPVMPQSARRSGWVDLEFDIGMDGRVDTDTVRVVGASENVFRDPSINVVESWVYPPGMPEIDRKAAEARITFVLSRPGGSIIPPLREAPTKE